MIRFLLPAVVVAAFASCHHATLEDSAEKMAQEYTERYCPTPTNNMQRTDSVTFNRTGHTFNYYYTLIGDADNNEAVNKVSKQIESTLLTELRENTSLKVFKDAGYSFRYVFRSQSNKNILWEHTFTAKAYR